MRPGAQATSSTTSQASDLKQCPKCSETKPLSQFNKDKTKRLGVSSYCKLCASEYSSSYYTANGERIRTRITKYTHSHVRYEYKSVLSRLKNLVAKAKGRRWKVEITYEYLVALWESQNGLCTYSGLPLTYEANQSNTVSLDRIDSKLGYIEGNVQLVCAMVNRMKQEFAEADFLSMCRTITENTKTKTTHAINPRLDNGYVNQADLFTLDSVDTSTTQQLIN